MEHDVGPSFSKVTGVSFSGFGAGSSQLANQIKGGVRVGDVFISASPLVDSTLEGSANGGWVSWVVQFASAPLVLGYERHGRFAAALGTVSWERAVTRSGFLVGRTDPVLDPKGKLTVQVLQRAAQIDRDPSLLGLLQSANNVFPEETLLGRLEAGQLDAGFFYANEAKEAGLATVGLSPVSLSASYTITILEHAPHHAAAMSFVSYLLGRSGRRLLTADGLHVVTPPHVHGTGVPSGLRSVLGS
jgi:molybdate/tungstate transport system substrate-binding protein